VAELTVHLLFIGIRVCRRHPGESRNPGAASSSLALDARFRGDDE